MTDSRPPITPEVVRRVLELRDAGTSWGRISTEVGIPRRVAWAVYKVLRRKSHRRTFQERART